MIHSTGVKDATTISRSKPRRNTKKDRTLPAKSDKKKVKDHSRNNKSSVKQKNRVDYSITYKRTIINSNSNFVCKTCNKFLMSFNHDKTPTKIGDPTYQTLHIRLFSNAGRTDHPLVFGLRYIRTDNGTEFVNQVLTEFYESVGIFYQKSVPRTPRQNDIVERRNHTLVEAARTMLIFSKALMFLWAEAIATTFYT
nr:putative ribonuclease H-like domain-containing protein [Tanacetum cinerariifolium]